MRPERNDPVIRKSYAAAATGVWRQVTGTTDLRWAESNNVHAVERIGLKFRIPELLPPIRK